jgi:hypothetical protein
MLYAPAKTDSKFLNVKITNDFHKFDVKTPPKYDRKKKMYFAEIITKTNIRKCCLVGDKWYLI